MPADYSSTARALALPISPSRSPRASSQTHQSSWALRRSSQSRSRGPSSSDRGALGFRDNVIDTAERLQRRFLQTAYKLTLFQRVLAGVALLTAAVLTILVLVFNEPFFAWLEPFAAKWKNLRGGWLILWAMTFTTAFPPVIGYSTCVTIAGFVYGVPEGWFIVASATIIGSLCSFLVSRTILSNFVHRLVANDTRFEALSLVLEYDGLKLLCMIRLCPLPYSLSNGAISTFPTVKPWTFALATAIASPKLMIHIFIGGRLAAIARSGEKMDPGTKAINWASIIGGAIIGVLTGWLIYRRTMARARQLESEQISDERRPATRRRYSDDPENTTASPTMAREDRLDFLPPDDPMAYQDDFTDDDDEEVFRHGDAHNGNDAMSLKKQPSQS